MKYNLCLLLSLLVFYVITVSASNGWGYVNNNFNSEGCTSDSDYELPDPTSEFLSENDNSTAQGIYSESRIGHNSPEMSNHVSSYLNSQNFKALRPGSLNKSSDALPNVQENSFTSSIRHNSPERSKYWDSNPSSTNYGLGNQTYGRSFEDVKEEDYDVSSWKSEYLNATLIGFSVVTVLSVIGSMIASIVQNVPI